MYAARVSPFHGQRKEKKEGKKEKKRQWRRQLTKRMARTVVKVFIADRVHLFQANFGTSFSRISLAALNKVTLFETAW